jgi:hypothetical protein
MCIYGGRGDEVVVGKVCTLMTLCIDALTAAMSSGTVW